MLFLEVFLLHRVLTELCLYFFFFQVKTIRRWNSVVLSKRPLKHSEQTWIIKVTQSESIPDLPCFSTPNTSLEVSIQQRIKDYDNSKMVQLLNEPWGPWLLKSELEHEECNLKKRKRENKKWECILLQVLEEDTPLDWRQGFCDNNFSLNNLSTSSPTIPSFQGAPIILEKCWTYV